MPSKFEICFVSVILRSFAPVFKELRISPYLTFLLNFSDVQIEFEGIKGKIFEEEDDKVNNGDKTDEQHGENTKDAPH